MLKHVIIKVGMIACAISAFRTAHAAQSPSDGALFWPSNASQMQAAIDQVRQLDQFEATIRMTDLSRNWVISDTQVYGNQDEGRLEVVSHFYDRKDKYDKVVTPAMTMRLLGDFHQQQFAINYGQMLSDMESHALAGQSSSFQKHLKQYPDTYVSFGLSPNQPSSMPHLIDLFMMRPQASKLSEMDSQFFHFNGRDYRLLASRIQLPLGLFDQESYFDLYFRVKGDASLSLQSDLQSQHLGMQTTIALDQESLLDQILTFVGLDPTGNYYNFRWNSQLSQDKLTHAWLQVDPFDQTYSLRTVGIRQDIELNLLQEETAKFELRQYLLEMDIRPSDKHIDSIQDVDSIPWYDIQ